VTAICAALLSMGVAACAEGSKTPQTAGAAQNLGRVHARCAAEVPGTAVSLQRVGDRLEVAYRTREPLQVDDLRAHAFRQGQTARGRASGGGLTSPVQSLPPVIVQVRTIPDGLVIAYSTREAEDFEIVHTMLRDDVERQNQGQCGIVRPGSLGTEARAQGGPPTWDSDPVPEAPDREWKLTITAIQVSEPLARRCRIPQDRRLEVFDAADLRLDGYPVLTALVKCLQSSGEERPLRVLGRADPADDAGPYESILGKSRAASVATFLEQAGFKVEVVDHAGPLERTAADDQGWSWERRVDIE